MRMQNDNQKNDQKQNNLELNEIALRSEITQEGIIQQFYSSEIEQIIQKEFQNPRYLQEISLEGEKINYQTDHFDYQFPLQSKTLYHKPKLEEILQFENFEGVKLNPKCVATATNKIAIAYSENLQIWNKKKQKEYILEIPDISCMDFSRDGEVLICGQNKTILFIAGNSGQLMQQFLNIHLNKLIVIKCIWKTENEQIVTVSMDCVGQSLLINFTKSIFSYTADKQQMIQNIKQPTGAIKYIHMTDNRVLVAINSIQSFMLAQVEIVSTEQVQSKIVYEFRNERKVRDFQIFKTSCALGRGLIKTQDDYEKKYVIVFTWDNKLYQIIVENDKSLEFGKNCFVQSQQINVGSLIYECQFLKDSVYMLLTEKGIIMFSTINIEIVKENQILSQVKHQYFITSMIKIKGYEFRKCKTLMKKVTQGYTKLKLDNDPICNFSQQFSQLTAIFENKCYTINLVSSRDMVNRLINQEEWLYCMNYVLSLYELYNEFYCEYFQLRKIERHQLIKQSVEEVSLSYFKFCMQIIRSSNLGDEISKYKQQEIKATNNTLYSLLIEFLLRSDSYELLFERIMSDTTLLLKDNHTFFLYCLEAFYQEKLVKLIPNTILGKIVDIYLQQNRLDLLQLLIQSLDHSSIKSDQLMKICLKYGLIKSLAIICSQSDLDQQLTPINKFWAIIQTMIEKQQFETCIFYACRALALMKMIYSNQTILGEIVEESKSKEIKKQLSSWFLKDEVIEKLLTLQMVSTFEVLLKLLEYQKSNDKTNYSRTQLIVSKVISTIQAGSNDFQTKYQAQISDTFLDDLNQQYILFQIRGFIQFGGYLYRIGEYLGLMLKNPVMFTWIYFEELVDSIKHNQYLQTLATQWYYKKDIIQFLKCQYFINIIIKIEEQPSTYNVNEILGLGYEADFTTFSYISVYFAEKKKEYTRAFNFFLTSQNRFVRTLVFDWVERIMSSLQKTDEDNFIQMKQALILKISDLIQIDWHKTRIIFSNYNSESEKAVVDKLSQFPELQLQYIENVLRKDRELGNKLDENLLIIHIQLLCQLNPDKIISEVSAHEYPLEDILDICRQYQVLPAQAYVLERMGKIVESVQIHCTILKQLIQRHKAELDSNYKLSMKLGGGADLKSKVANLKKVLFPLGKKKKKDGQQEGELNVMKPYEDAKSNAVHEIVNHIQRIVKMCRTDKFERNEEKWYELLDNLIDIRDNLIFDSPSQRFMKHEIFTTQICHIFATIAEVSNLSSLIYQLSNRYNNLDLGQLKKAFQEIIQNYLYTQHLQSNIQFLLMTDIYEKLTQYIQKSKIGISSNRLCYKNRIDGALTNDCQVQNDDFVVFECKHSYHKKCVLMHQGLAFCNICFKIDQTYSFKIINSKIIESESVLDVDDNDILKEEIENVNKFNNQSSKQNSDEVKLIPKVSSETMEKRKKRVNKLYYWDRKRMDNFNIMEETNKDIDYFNNQKEMKQKKQELDENQKRLNKKKK